MYGMGKLTRFKGMEESFEVNHFQVHGWSSDGCPEEVTSTVELINLLNSGCLNSTTGINNHVINPYWQIMENSSRNFSAIFIFRETHPLEFFD